MVYKIAESNEAKDIVKMGLIIENAKELFKNSVFKNFSWMFVTRLINIIGSFVVSIIAARNWGTEAYGEYNYAIAFVAILSPLYFWGIESYAIKEFAQNKDDIDITFGTIFYSLGFLSVVVTAIIFLISSIGEISYNKKIYIWITLIPNLLNSLFTARYYLEGIKKVKLLSLFQIWLQLLLLFAKVIVLIYNTTVLAFVIVCSSESFLQLILYYVALRAEKCYIPRAFSKDKLYSIFKVCAPLFLSSFTVSIYMRIDQLMVGSALGDSALGKYSVAVKLSEIWYIIPATIYTAFLPVLSNDMYSDRKKFWKKLQNFADVLGIVSYFAVVLLIVLGTRIILIAYGEDYYEAGSIIKIYVLGGIAVGIGYTLSAYVNINEYSMFSLIDTLIGCVLNVLLNFLLIPRLGIFGAAIATVVTCYSGAFFMCFCYGIVNEDYRRVFWCQIKALFPFARVIKYMLKMY